MIEMIEKCSKCQSENTYREWIKVGMYVSYYYLHCKDCNFKEEKRIHDPIS